MICRKCKVTGSVQGVFYRATVQEHALDNGIKGYAKNLSDGSVEVLLCGERLFVDRIADWLWDGPAYADVESVECEELEFQQLSDFKIE